MMSLILSQIIIEQDVALAKIERLERALQDMTGDNTKIKKILA